MLALALGLLARPTPVEATYAGANGKIAFIHTWVGIGHRSRDLRLRVVNADGSGNRELAKNATGPAFSPNGRTIAYVCRLDDRPSHICVIDADGRNRRHVTNGRQSDVTPVFSRDGQSIAFTRAGALYAVDVRGGEPHPMTLIEAYAYGPGLPSVSPDGSTVVFSDTHGLSGGSIFTRTLGGSDSQPVPGSPTDTFGPAFSPDGRSLVFLRKFLAPDGGSYDEHYSDVYTMNLDGTGLRALTHTRAGWDSAEVVWGPSPG